MFTGSCAEVWNVLAGTNAGSPTAAVQSPSGIAALMSAPPMGDAKARARLANVSKAHAVWQQANQRFAAMRAAAADPEIVLGTDGDLAERRRVIDEYKRRIEADEAGDDDRHKLRQAIARGKAMLAVLDASHGDYIRMLNAYSVPDRIDRGAQNPRLWAISCHEGAHVVASIVVGGNVEGAIVRPDLSGSSWSTEPSSLDRAVVIAAGVEGAQMFGGDLRPMDMRRPADDHYQFREAMTAATGDDLGHTSREADQAKARAGAIVARNRGALLAVARALFDNVGTKLEGAILHEIAAAWPADRVLVGDPLPGW